VSALIIDDENLDDADQIQMLIAALNEEERLDNELLAEIEELEAKLK
jgi:hypothetical protein